MIGPFRVLVLDRYVVRQFLRLFLTFALAAPLLFIVFDLTDNLDRMLDRGLGAGEVALSYVYQYPQFVLWAFPIAALMATVFTVNGMARHFEVTAAKAGGMSFRRLFVTLPLLGILLTGAGLALGELVPRTTRLRAEVLGQRPRLVGGRTNFVWEGDWTGTLVVPRLDAENGRLHNPSIEREGDGERSPTIQVVAEAATYRVSRADWDVENGRMRVLWKDGAERAFRFDRLRWRGFTQTPEELLARAKDPEEMSYRELQRFIQASERAGGQPRKLKVELGEKLAIPVTTLVIILFGTPLATAAPRAGAAFGVGISLIITISYLMLFRLTGAMGAAGQIQPELAPWIPNVLFFVAALGLTARVRT
ncbi:MAG: LptF/LptG family permease [Gemmatimonadota bacterium]